MQIARFLTQILEGGFFRTIFQHKRAVAVHTQWWRCSASCTMTASLPLLLCCINAPALSTFLGKQHTQWRLSGDIRGSCILVGKMNNFVQKNVHFGDKIVPSQCGRFLGKHTQGNVEAVGGVAPLARVLHCIPVHPALTRLLHYATLHYINTT